MIKAAAFVVTGAAAVQGPPERRHRGGGRGGRRLLRARAGARHPPAAGCSHQQLLMQSSCGERSMRQAQHAEARQRNRRVAGMQATAATAMPAACAGRKSCGCGRAVEVGLATHRNWYCCRCWLAVNGISCDGDIISTTTVSAFRRPYHACAMGCRGGDTIKAQHAASAKARCLSASVIKPMHCDLRPRFAAIKWAATMCFNVSSPVFCHSAME